MLCKMVGTCFGNKYYSLSACAIEHIKPFKKLTWFRNNLLQCNLGNGVYVIFISKNIINPLTVYKLVLVALSSSYNHAHKQRVIITEFQASFFL